MRPDVVKGNVFVANLPLGFTDEQLAELFDPYGIVLRAYLARDPATGQTQGHGLVELAPEKIVEAAIAGVAAARPGGRRVDVRRADDTMCIVAKRPAPKPRLTRESGPYVETRSPSRPPREVQVIRTNRSDRSGTERSDRWNTGRLTLR